MKALKEPIKTNYGIDFIARFTNEFKVLIDSATEKIEPFSKQEISQYTYYFKVKGKEVSSEFDCCDNEKCIKQTKADIRKQYGKGTHIEEVYYDNDGDHENIEMCYQCAKPLNEWLTWCNTELEYLEENKPWITEFLKEEGFLIHCILQSTPTMDCNISNYHKHQGGEILKQALIRREEFFQRIGELANSVIENIR